jgi:hypothetical protein
VVRVLRLFVKVEDVVELQLRDITRLVDEVIADVLDRESGVRQAVLQSLGKTKPELVFPEKTCPRIVCVLDDALEGTEYLAHEVLHVKHIVPAPSTSPTTK